MRLDIVTFQVVQFFFVRYISVIVNCKVEVLLLG